MSAPGAADEEVQALLVEIFARTGQKVEAGDPVVVYPPSTLTDGARVALRAP